MRFRRWLGLALLAVACREQPAAPVHDDLGRGVALPRHIERIVTLAPSLSEIVCAAGAQSRLVATDDFSNYPPQLRKLPKVGGMQPDIEQIVSLHPDVVLASTEGNHPNLGPALAAVGIPLFVVRTDRLAEIAPAIARLGRLIDAPRGDAAARELERAVAAQKRQRSRPARVLFAVWTDPLYVAGRDTFTGDLIALTGAVNAVAASGWPQYSLEAFVAAPPDILLYPRGSVSAAQVAALLAHAPRARTRAVPVDEDIFQRPGPRVAEAAKGLNAILDQAERDAAGR